MTSVVFVVSGVTVLVVVALALARGRRTGRPEQSPAPAPVSPRTPRTAFNPRLYAFEVGLVIATAIIAAAFGTLSLNGVLILSAVALATPILLRALLTPWLALLILVLVELSNAGALLPGFAGLNAYTGALALATVALVLGLVRGELRPVWSPLYLLAGIFLVTQLVTLLAAVDTPVGLADITETVKDLIFLLVVTALLIMTRRHDRVLAGAVIFMTLLTGLTFVNELALRDPYAFFGFSQIPLDFDTGTTTSRHSGPQADPNFWARSIVLFVPFALSLWIAAGAGHRGNLRWLLRWGWALAAVVLATGVYLTQSRGGMLALLLAVLLWLLLAGGRYRRLLLLSPVALLLIPLVPGVGSRLATLQGLGGARSAVGEYSLVERVALQEVGLSIVAANPAIGVGPGNFGSAFLDYNAESFVQPRVQDDPYFAHNLYLELAAEGGVVGLTGWLVFYGGAVLLATRAVLVSPGGGTAPMVHTRRLALSTVIALVGWGTASIFLHMAHFRVLALALALAAALDLQARSNAVATLPAVARETALRASRRRRRAWVTAVAAWGAVVGVGTVTVGLRESVWQTRHTALVLPVDDTGAGGNAYELDLLSRRPMMPTLAAIIASPRFAIEASERLGLAPEERGAVDVGVRASPQSTAVIVTATSADVRLSDGMSRGVLESGRSYVNGLDRAYGLGPAASSEPGPILVPRIRWGALLALLGIATAAALLVHRAVSRG